MLPQARFSWVWLPQHSGMGCHGERKVLASVPATLTCIPTAPTPAPNPPAGSAGLQPQEEQSLPPNSGQEGGCWEHPPGPG